VKNDARRREENLSGPHQLPPPESAQISCHETGAHGVIRLFVMSPSLVLLARRYLAFGIVGASGVGVDMAALFVLADPRTMHLNLSLAKALAAEIAIVSNFIGNEFWTFRDLAVTDLSWRGRATRLGIFNLICLAGIGLSVLLLIIQTRYFQMNMYLGNLISVGIVSLWNFGMNRRFGWKVGKTKHHY
jgi:dolichol-phosphate mannosyltransferase